MAANLETPVDHLTGLPLPIIQEQPLPLYQPGQADWHHHFHPSSAEVLTSSLGGRALRHSRVQLVDRQTHNEGQRAYHRFFAGPPIPEDETDQFRLAIMACAGYLPQFGIDLSGDSPRVRSMNRQELKLLRTVSPPKSKRDTQALFGYRNLRYRYEPMRDFFTDYTLAQPIDINDSEVNEFLMTKDDLRKRYLGQIILLGMVDLASESVEGEYSKLLRSGRLHKRMPARPRSLIFNKLGYVARRRSIILPQLEERIIIG